MNKIGFLVALPSATELTVVSHSLPTVKELNTQDTI
mgnify:CR=1 FL=1